MRQIILAGLITISATLTSSAIAQCNGRYEDSLFSEIEKTTLTYSPVFNDGQHQLDLYSPKNDSEEKRPLIVYIHGGSFISGDKSGIDCQHFAEYFAKRGYVVASINYRLANPFLFLASKQVQYQAVLEAMVDAKTSIRFFLNSTREGNPYHLDSQAFFLGGYSAGAVTALHATWIDRMDELSPEIQSIVSSTIGDLNGDAGFSTLPFPVQGLFSFSGALHQTSYLDSSDTETCYSIHSKDDSTVWYECGPAYGNPDLLQLCGSGSLEDRDGILGKELHHLVTLDKAGHGWAGLGNANPVFRWALDSINQYLYPMLPCAKSPLGLSSLGNTNFEIFPNPCHGSETIHLRTESKFVQIRSLQGSLIGQFPVTEGKIKLPNLPGGMYFLQTEINKQRLTRTFMVTTP